MERVMGIEPTQSAWKAEILPLNYTRIDTICDGKSGTTQTAHIYYHKSFRLSIRLEDFFLKIHFFASQNFTKRAVVFCAEATRRLRRNGYSVT